MCESIPLDSLTTDLACTCCTIKTEISALIHLQLSPNALFITDVQHEHVSATNKLGLQLLF